VNLGNNGLSSPELLSLDGAIIVLSCLYCPALGEPSQTNSCVGDRIGVYSTNWIEQSMPLFNAATKDENGGASAGEVARFSLVL
jgi:hypothetical protein